MNEIVIKKLKKQLKYNGTVILKYEIDYPQITLSQYSQGKEKFNRYNEGRAIKLRKYAENELFTQAVNAYEYNMQNGYPVLVYEVIEKYTITYNIKSIVSLYSDQYIYSRRCTRKYNTLISKLGIKK